MQKEPHPPFCTQESPGPQGAVQSPPVSSWRGTKRFAALNAGALLAILAIGCGSSGSGGGIEELRGETGSPLLEFGEEGGSAELKQATETADAFLAARAKGDWSTVCAQLSAALVEKLEKLASHSTGLSDTSCASFLEAFIRLTPTQKRETSAEGGALRQADERGYLIYPGPEGTVEAMQVVGEDGGWRVGALGVRELR